MGLVVGIDLGTTNSCVSIIKDNRPRVIEDDRGYNILPSCVAMKGRGRFVVGHGAKALILTNPRETLYAMKRFVGRQFASPEVQEAAKQVSYDVVEASDGSVLLRMGELDLAPEEALSIVLKAVKEIAEKTLGEEVTDAVITVPAHFSHLQRKATMTAGEKAGLNVLRLINEPTAAALAFGFKREFHKRLAIFDLGGGTFDVSIVEAGDGVYEILGTAGDTFLGGEDFDYRIVNWLADTFKTQTGFDPRQDRVQLQRLKDAAERAKCELSFVDRVPILIPRLHGEHNLEADFTRDKLEAMVEDLINETIKITDQALRSANVSSHELDEIVLVGGMTRMPRIQEKIKAFFGKDPSRGVHPEEVVAIGAAVHAFSLESEGEGGHLLLDVTPLTLGMDVAGGFFRSIINKNTAVPCQETRTFTTVKDFQTEVNVVVRQGESRLARENDLLGEFVLAGVREAEKMVPRIDVTFRIDSSGMLQVSALDRDTGESQAIKIKNYIESDAPGSDSKAVALARDDVQLVNSLEPATVAGVPNPMAGAGPGKGLKGKLAGIFGRKKGKAAPPQPPMAPLAEPPAAGLTQSTASDPRVSATRPMPARPVTPPPPHSGGSRPVAAPHAGRRGGSPLAEFSDDLGRAVGGDPSALGSGDSLGVAPRQADDFGVVPRQADDFGVARRQADDFGVAPRGAEDFSVAPRGAEDFSVAPRPDQAAPGAAPPLQEPAWPETVPVQDAFGVAPRGDLPGFADGVLPPPPPPNVPGRWGSESPPPPPSSGGMPDLPGLSNGGLPPLDAAGIPDLDMGGLMEVGGPAPSEHDAYGTRSPSPAAASAAGGLPDLSDLPQLDSYGAGGGGGAVPQPLDLPPELGETNDLANPFLANPNVMSTRPFDAPDEAFQQALGAHGGHADANPDDMTAVAPKQTASPPKPARKPAKLRISYKKNSTFLKEYTRNLERGGTFIKTKKPLGVGRECVLHVTVPGLEGTLQLRGSVVWSSKDAEVGSGQEEGMGIRYDPTDTAGMEGMYAALQDLQAR